MSKKLKIRQIRQVFKILAQGRPQPEREYLKGLMRCISGRLKGAKL